LEVEGKDRAFGPRLLVRPDLKEAQQAGSYKWDGGNYWMTLLAIVSARNQRRFSAVENTVIHTRYYQV
jgi:hypothetical protein